MNLPQGIIAGLSLGLGLIGRSEAAGGSVPIDPLISASQEADRFIKNHADGIFVAAPGDGAPGLIQIERWQTLSAPDAQTLDWLSGRIPGLDAKNVRTVTLEGSDRVMRSAVAAKVTYLDLLTDPGLRKGRSELYFVPQDVMQVIDQKYVSGTFPASGTAKSGRPFKMQGIVAGAGSIIFLYDQTGEFIFANDNYEIKIAPGGKITSVIEGPADLTTSGVSGCMRVGFYFCAEIQRTTKVSDGKITVQTSRGPQDRDIRPIQAR